ncbi:MAG: response regulator, partial [Hyphomicrobiaceae bacterium]
MSSARKILIVDDDDDLRDSLTDQMALYDEFELVAASTAGQGLELARSGHFDLLILDVSLPDM